ncbi:RNA polymerase sigma-70 factor [Chitinophaga sp. SYP-B3965]|uniref:RNA polymerase sigma factor n=1 Tax=Chitinophaga sp. SYP-B3965 TaxID=2663120 RepID=UPI001299F6BF|nr:RNA polymerase sigma-70 factor [Chitinophaga sp. SYP-B3965]MRG48800.1 RNA polymerase sigma-70 factor [Chitinophaga sp. SYP-B3965]
MQEQTDIEREWLVKLSRGEESVFRELFDRYHPFVYSFALRMTESDPIAKDVVQDVFVKIWINRESLHTIDNLPAYLNRMTRNLVLNGMKRKAHEESLIRDLFPAGNERNTTEDAALAKELETLLHNAINQLPGQQQKVYRLSRIKGLKHEDIAEQLHISRETVKKHMMAAVRGVKDYLQEHGGTVSFLAICLLKMYR